VGWLLSKVQNPKFEIHTWKRGLAVRARRSTDNNPNPTLVIHYPILACETPTGSIIFYPRSERANPGLCAAGLTVSVDLLLYWVGGNSCGRLFQRWNLILKTEGAAIEEMELYMCLYILRLGTWIELGPEGSTSVEINHVPIEMQPKEVRYVTSSATE
jgi:hypothetical protein